jgi:hypothetical protein
MYNTLPRGLLATHPARIRIAGTSYTATRNNVRELYIAEHLASTMHNVDRFWNPLLKFIKIKINIKIKN